MHGYGLDGSRGWADNLWDMLNDGGVWGVPRSGLMYRKEAEGARFVLYERMPYHPDMPCTREELHEAQEDDHRGIVVMFAVIGVTVVDDTHSRNVRESEGGGH